MELLPGYVDLYYRPEVIFLTVFTLYLPESGKFTATMVQQSGGNVSAVANLATQQTPTSIRMTISVIVVLPILFVYPIFQKSFVKGIMIGSVKG